MGNANAAIVICEEQCCNQQSSTAVKIEVGIPEEQQKVIEEPDPVPISEVPSEVSAPIVDEGPGEAATIAASIETLPDPLKQAWKAFSKEYKVQLKLWESMAPLQAKSNPAILEQQEAAKTAVENAMRTYSSDQAGSAKLLEIAMESYKDLFNNSTASSSVQVIAGAEVFSSRRTLVDWLKKVESKQDLTLQPQEIEDLLGACKIDAKLQYRARPVLGLVPGPTTPRQGTPRQGTPRQGP
eukprot:TRINITY_DN13648_c0_g1_i1.p1 TRINITY_DN13648_c0_g1~~TRINITY_DN13648_c0_g1_i1.p1  ORF type:complete len:240 (-),score=46.91 TRINITY_DN13648_c0_g1_i1:100-819(-)